MLPNDENVNCRDCRLLPNTAAAKAVGTVHEMTKRSHVGTDGIRNQQYLLSAVFSTPQLLLLLDFWMYPSLCSKKDDIASPRDTRD